MPVTDHKRLRGRPLASRGKFLITRSVIVLAYLLVLTVAIFATFGFERWLFKGVGLTMLAVLGFIAVELFGEGLLHLTGAFDYERYRDEWGRANEPASNHQ